MCAQQKARPLVLVGPMGSGKSTLGKALAQALEVPFLDLDEKIVQDNAMSIPDIFARFGEDDFRRREHAALADALTHFNGVIASGGGIIKLAANRELLKTKARTIYLNCTVDVQYARTLNDSNRPMIKQDDAYASLAQLFSQRDPLYREVASFSVVTGAHDIAACIAKIKTFLAA